MPAGTPAGPLEVISGLLVLMRGRKCPPQRPKAVTRQNPGDFRPESGLFWGCPGYVSCSRESRIQEYQDHDFEAHRPRIARGRVRDCRWRRRLPGGPAAARRPARRSPGAASERARMPSLALRNPRPIIAPESAVKPTAAPAPESRDAAKTAPKVEPVERATAPKPSPRPRKSASTVGSHCCTSRGRAEKQYVRQQYSESAWPRERARSRGRAQLDSSRSIADSRCGTGSARACDSRSASRAAQAAGRRGSGPGILRCWTARCDVSHQRDGAR